MAPSLRKGKARAEEHKGKVITSKKKSHTRIRLTQQEVINKYIQDHQEDWDTKSEGAQQRLIDDLGAAWDAPSNTESESEQSYADVKKQPSQDVLHGDEAEEELGLARLVSSYTLPHQNSQPGERGRQIARSKVLSRRTRDT